MKEARKGMEKREDNQDIIGISADKLSYKWQFGLSDKKPLKVFKSLRKIPPSLTGR